MTTTSEQRSTAMGRIAAQRVAAAKRIKELEELDRKNLNVALALNERIKELEGMLVQMQNAAIDLAKQVKSLGAREVRDAMGKHV